MVILMPSDENNSKGEYYNEEEVEETDAEPEDNLEPEKDEIEAIPEKEGKDLYAMPVVDEVLANPTVIVQSNEATQLLQSNTEIRQKLAPDEDTDGKIHPGFVSSYSFGEKEFERIAYMLVRLDEAAERVLTYHKDNMMYFPQFYAVLNNLFINIRFLLSTYDRKRISDALIYVKQAVIEYTTTGGMNTLAIMMLEEVYGLIINLKNFHGLGVSFEKRKGQSEKYYNALFKKKRGIGLG